jgi:hypothetical protein
MRSNFGASEMLGMRVLFAVALIALGLAGVSAASAGSARGYSSLGRHAALLWIYDYQPGIVVRAYWAAPWRHRHYYPTTGEKPESGRLEDLTGGAGGAPEPAETFERSWSTPSAFLPELPRDFDAPPPMEPPPQNSRPLK